MFPRKPETHDTPSFNGLSPCFPAKKKETRMVGRPTMSSWTQVAMWQIPRLPTPRPAVLAPSDEIGLNWAWILHGITGYNPPRHAWIWLDMGWVWTEKQRASHTSGLNPLCFLKRDCLPLRWRFKGAEQWHYQVYNMFVYVYILYVNVISNHLII